MIRYLVLLLLVLFGCAEQHEPYIERGVDDLYNTAMDDLERRNYVKAAKSFAEVERQHPYSKWALKAQLMSAYSYYEAKKYEEALEGFLSFTQLHPGHPEVDYAYYMLGMCYYEQIPIVERDQKATEKAYKAFEEVVERFPDSIYARDAKFKLDLVRDHLAAKEMYIGRYYQSHGNYLAATNRFQVVIKNYQATSHTTEALLRLVECYLALGLRNEAQAAAAVLGHNYPNSSWYREAYRLMESCKKN